ncbi:phenylacetaldehyde reductase-like [Andrographis paniculata]|uniref:phenylacetaldehyde reductase-like n=1 Tax=Andrographis paniculata TaxID=175694 RepID=UPI0021E6E579|nr:phenylacetaldehyde reductase-like [Andrographis paniculata]XP_051124258.1 phenylacetaldehyde reductase-like [Andrographis paniculata]
MAGGEGKVVCVTGASGFIASCLIETLLRRGYTVKATVRNVADPNKVNHLKAMEGAKERLRLFQADLMVDASFDAAVDGCDGVFHTASPVVFDNIKDPQTELIEPAVNGTPNVLRSCLRSSSVKRVVLTSSLAAVVVNRKGLDGNAIADETWQSEPGFCEETQAWYCLSKTLAEEAAWNFAKSHGIDLVVINPGLVIGRCLQPILNVTFEEFLHIITQGTSPIAAIGVVILVDVKDVVQAHILAFENPSANGRYCLASASLYISEVREIIQQLYPTFTLPPCVENDRLNGNALQISKEKVKSLGVDFVPIEQSIKETIEFLKERNMLVIP